MKSQVAVIRCDDYNYPSVRSAVYRGIDLVGGISSFVKPHEKILLKPNLLTGEPPGNAVTTHPMVFKAAAELFMENGAELYYGDSPGFGNPARIAQQSGIKEIADQLHITLADFHTAQKIFSPDALLAKQLFIAAGALDADGIINLCKMKTHGFTRITGAVKNLFGCIPGLRKGEFHVKMPDIFDFSRLLVDIVSFLKPRLHIMDGILAMEGNGPRGGKPTRMKVLLFSKDPIALDAVFCRLIDLNPEFVPTCTFGHEASIGTYKAEDIEILGDDIKELTNKNFIAVRRPPDRLASTRGFPPFLKNLVSPKPVIDYLRCTNCGTCVRQCPLLPKALYRLDNQQDQKPLFNYRHCIRCYCCQEMCPEKAISIKTPLLGKIIHR